VAPREKAIDRSSTKIDSARSGGGVVSWRDVLQIGGRTSCRLHLDKLRFLVRPWFRGYRKQ